MSMFEDREAQLIEARFQSAQSLGITTLAASTMRLAHASNKEEI